MTQRSRPISYYLQRCKNRKHQIQTAQEWAQEWHDQAIRLLTELDNSAEKDWAKFDAAMKTLRKLTHRKHDALKKVFETLALDEPPKRG